MKKTIYNYRKTTGEYLEPTEADECQKQPGVFLIPANATETAPPASRAGKARCYIGGAWVQVLDKRGTYYWVDGVKHIINELGEDVPSGASLTEPLPTPEQLSAQFTAAISTAAQARLDAKARERRYDGILSLCSYANDPDPALRAEGEAGVRWRSQTWTTLEAMDVAVKSGARSAPASVDDVLAELPALEWPPAA